MRISWKLVGALFAVLGALCAPAYAQEAQPGDACSVNGALIHSGGPEIADGHILVCDGSNWQSVIEFGDDAESLFQVGFDSGPCNASKEGRLRYDNAADDWEYCDGTNWAALVPAAGAGGGLVVYQADGTTVLGDFLPLGTGQHNCAYAYLDSTTHLPVFLAEADCATFFGDVYFATSSCSGGARIFGNSVRGGYACTGSASCQTNLVRRNLSQISIFNFNSRRRSNGDCLVESGSLSSGNNYTVAPKLCDAGACQIR